MLGSIGNTLPATAVTGRSPLVLPPTTVGHVQQRQALVRAPFTAARVPCQQLDGQARQSVVCLAHPRRVAKVASQIQREIGEMFVTDQVLQEAICPERQLGDNALSAVASITQVYVSNDLQVVKVYVSIYSDDKGKRRAMNNLQRLEPYVRRLIGSRVRLRLTPEIRFEYDDTLEEMDLVQRVLGAEEVAKYRAEIEGVSVDELDQQGGAGAAGEGGDDDDDDAGFFDDVEDDDDGDDQLWDEPQQSFPDPFSDLFTGKGEGDVVQSQQQRQQRRGGKRGGRGAATLDS